MSRRGGRVNRGSEKGHGRLPRSRDTAGGGGRITEVTLRPEVTVADASMTEKGKSLHGDIDALCFIARSVTFPVSHEPVTRVQEA
jgi:organic hydroperoxide reductase OsmC/OhrA